jgi:hypothetical protein
MSAAFFFLFPRRGAVVTIINPQRRCSGIFFVRTPSCLSSRLHGLRYVLLFSLLSRCIHRPSGSTKDPFSSSASLDVNPFDDPFADQDSVNKTPQYLPELTASRAADLERREQDLERRERELHQKAENIRKHGRNNWPRCEYYPLTSYTFPHLRPNLLQSFPSFTMTLGRKFLKHLGPSSNGSTSYGSSLRALWS